MIEKMTKYSFILLNGEEKDFLSRLQELGLLDITRSVKPVDNQSSGLLARAETYRRLMTELEKVFIPEETVPVPPGEDIAGEAEKALKELEKLVEERKAAEKAYAAALPWGTFESEKLLALQEAGLTIHFHSVPAKTFREEWKETVPLSVISEAKTVRFVTVLPAGETDPLPGEIQAPDEAPELIKDRISGLEAAIDRQKSVIYGIKQQIGKIDALYRPHWTSTSPVSRPLLQRRIPSSPSSGSPRPGRKTLSAQPWTRREYSISRKPPARRRTLPSS